MSKLIKLLLAMTLTAAALFVARAAMADEVKPADARPAETAKRPREVQISVTEKGFQPSPIKVKKDEPLELVVTRKTDHTCAKQLVLDEGNIDVELPLNKPVKIPFTPAKTGTIKYGCAMGKMMSGQLVVE